VSKSKRYRRNDDGTLTLLARMGVACESCWRKPTDEITPCGKLDAAGLCPDCAIDIAQGRPIRFMTYVKFRNIERAHQAKTLAAASPEDKATGIANRCAWLDKQMRTRAEFSSEVNECRFCGTEPALHSWPTAFRCACVEAYVVDRWFPDNIERVHRMTMAKQSTDGTLTLLERMGLPVTRETYLRAAFLGNPPEGLDGEIEAELPEELQRNENRLFLTAADRGMLRKMGIQIAKGQK